jgi:hypothetical protein
LIAAAVALAAGPARADEAPRRSWNVAAPISAPISGGLAIEADRQLAGRLSISGLGGARSTAAGDYDSLSLGLAAEVRWWLLGWTVKSPLRESIVGGYFGAGAELSRVWLRRDGRGVGATTSATAVGSFGYRFAPWSRVSITPSIGLAIGRDVDLDGRVPDRTTFRLRLGLTLGALF